MTRSSTILGTMLFFSLVTNGYWFATQRFGESHSDNHIAKRDTRPTTNEHALEHIEQQETYTYYKKSSRDNTDHNLLQRWEKEQLPQALLKSLAAYRVQKRISDAQRSFYSGDNTPRYWKEEGNQHRQRLHQRIAQTEALRREIIALFGSGITEDPEFAYLFKPFPKHNYLSSDEQLALEEIKNHRYLSLGERRRQLRAFAEEDAIRDVLSEAQFREYQLRESPLASKLKRDLRGFDYTEAEFRDLFDLLDTQKQTHQEQSDATVSRVSYHNFLSAQEHDTEQAFRNYLGEERYENYLETRKPSYKAVLDFANDYAVSEYEIRNLHTIVELSISRLAKVTRSTLENEQKQRQRQQIKQEARASIAELIGDDAGHALVERVL